MAVEKANDGRPGAKTEHAVPNKRLEAWGVGEQYTGVRELPQLYQSDVSIYWQFERHSLRSAQIMNNYAARFRRLLLNGSTLRQVGTFVLK